MKKFFTMLFVLAITVGSAFATEARIEGMGKNDRYMLDEVSMFTNPGSFLLYPNILTGSLGNYTKVNWDRNLTDQWFGGWLTIDNIVVGAVLNRKDPLEKYLIDRKDLKYTQELSAPLYVMWNGDTVTSSGTSDSKYMWAGKSHIRDTLDEVTLNTEIPTPVGDVDVFLGYNLGKIGVGARFFVARQESLYNGDRKSASGIIKGNVGLVMKLDEKDFVDVSFSLANITYFSKIASGHGIPDLETGTKAFSANARAFLTTPYFKGQIVPSVKFEQTMVANDTISYVSPGVGYQREIEGGLFWAGLDYGYEKNIDVEAGVSNEVVTQSGNFSFGIEKQIAWPWFTLRVGGTKSIAREKDTSAVQNVTNSDNDRSVGDVVGAGFSFQVGENLTFDVTANERIPFTNPLNGSIATLATKICATYAF